MNCGIAVESNYWFVVFIILLLCCRCGAALHQGYGQPTGQERWQTRSYLILSIYNIWGVVCLMLISCLFLFQMLLWLVWVFLYTVRPAEDHMWKLIILISFEGLLWITKQLIMILIEIHAVLSTWIWKCLWVEHGCLGLVIFIDNEKYNVCLHQGEICDWLLGGSSLPKMM